MLRHRAFPHICHSTSMIRIRKDSYVSVSPSFGGWVGAADNLRGYVIIRKLLVPVTPHRKTQCSGRNRKTTHVYCTGTYQQVCGSGSGPIRIFLVGCGPFWSDLDPEFPYKTGSGSDLFFHTTVDCKRFLLTAVSYRYVP